MSTLTGLAQLRREQPIMYALMTACARVLGWCGWRDARRLADLMAAAERSLST